METLWYFTPGPTQVQSTGGSAKTPGIFLVLDPATDGGAAVNELPLHNTALLSLVFD
jgi:hypothetical protein